MIGSRTTETMTATSFPGLYVGHVEVVDNNDDRYPGAIKVSIPSIFGLSEGDESAVWARPCFPYGHFFVPEVGDKVWLAFENGNSQSPVWLGVWYPEGKTPNAAQISPPNKRVIESSSGHQIIFEDEDEGEKLILQDKSGNRIELGKNEITFTCKTKLKIDASGQRIEIIAASVDINEG